ncbi:MAG: hypothetical protein ACHQQS_03335 [Thermoanaerobaculales bacterium]
MKRTWVLALPLVSVIGLTGCPFESSVPLGEPRPGTLDARLLGEWQHAQADGTISNFALLPFNSAEYYVELRENEQEQERYRAYLVTVGGEQFLNINQVKAERTPRPFVFARYSISKDDVLTLRFVGDKAVPKPLGNDQKRLVKFVAAHLKGNDLDDGAEPLSLHRVPPKSP